MNKELRKLHPERIVTIDMKPQDQQSHPKLEKLLRQWGAESAAARSAPGADEPLPADLLAAVPVVEAKPSRFRRLLPMAAAASLALVAGFLLATVSHNRRPHAESDAAAYSAPVGSDRQERDMVHELTAAAQSHADEMQLLNSRHQQKLMQLQDNHREALAALESQLDASQRQADRLAAEWARKEREVIDTQQLLAAVRADVAKAGEEVAQLKEALRSAEESRLTDIARLESKADAAIRLADQMRHNWIRRTPVPNYLAVKEVVRSRDALSADIEEIIATAANVRASAKKDETRRLIDRLEVMLMQASFGGPQAAAARRDSSVTQHPRELIRRTMESEDAEPGENDELLNWFRDAHRVLSEVGDAN